MTKQLSSASARIWLDTVDPGVSETDVEQGNLWLNTTTFMSFLCKDATMGSQLWDATVSGTQCQCEKLGIDGTAAATTTLFTTNASSGNFFVTNVIIRLVSTTGFVTVPSLSIGSNGSVNDIVPITALTGVSTADMYSVLPVLTASTSVPVSTDLKLKMTTGAVATTYVIDATVIGFYL